MFKVHGNVTIGLNSTTGFHSLGWVPGRNIKSPSQEEILRSVIFIQPRTFATGPGTAMVIIDDRDVLAVKRTGLFTHRWSAKAVALISSQENFLCDNGYVTRRHCLLSVDFKVAGMSQPFPIPCRRRQCSLSQTRSLKLTLRNGTWGYSVTNKGFPCP